MNADTSGNDLFGLPVDTAIAFSNHKGVYKRGIEKQQKKLYKKLAFLLQFLERDEKILYVTMGCSPITLLEQLFTGAILLLSLKRCLFVFTDRRILHIPTKSNLLYRGTIAQILYADCRNIKISWGNLVANYKSGKKDKFPQICGRARKKIIAILKSVSFSGEASPMQERAHLCPRCAKPMLSGYYVCPHCALEFKNKAKARRLSIIYPGGGYFYTRHYVMGVVDAITESILILLFIMALVRLVTGDPEALGAVIIISLALAFEKILTVMHTDKSIDEFVTVGGSIKTQPGFSPQAAS